MSDIDFDLLSDLQNYNKEKYKHFKYYLPFEYNEDFERMLSARYMKVSRLKRRFVYLCCTYKYLYFVTFTFDDYYLNKSDKTHKRLIKDSLLSFDNNYKIILNADYGSKNERLHFHAIVGTNKKNNLDKHLKDNYPCFTKTERIYISNESISKLSKYINKLSNHAVKDTTQKSRLFYNFKGFEQFGCSCREVGNICYLIMNDLR